MMNNLLCKLFRPFIERCKRKKLELEYYACLEHLADVCVETLTDLFSVAKLVDANKDDAEWMKAFAKEFNDIKW